MSEATTTHVLNGRIELDRDGWGMALPPYHLYHDSKQYVPAEIADELLAALTALVTMRGGRGDFLKLVQQAEAAIRKATGQAT